MPNSEITFIKFNHDTTKLELGEYYGEIKIIDIAK